ncbi:hypothetical protein T07_13122 [Trichinella nelsoni]|uniref:Uncharacterized protein n=1 Tax=Trichinella nelsoni TaxID=6336 RepID=A0A0V0RUS5_9BILA|nr:hypothetical protein T07_13122 [Trichinella nelsoni]
MNLQTEEQCNRSADSVMMNSTDDDLFYLQTKNSANDMNKMDDFQCLNDHHMSDRTAFNKHPVERFEF